MPKIKPWVQILIALCLAVLVGLIVNGMLDPLSVEDGGTGKNLKSGLVDTFSYIGTLFMTALKMIIVPLIFSSIVVGIAGVGTARGFGRLGAKTLGYYLMTSFLAIVIGLSVVNLAKPGYKDGAPNTEIQAAFATDADSFATRIAQKVEGADTDGLKAVTDIFLRMVPDNVFKAFSDNGSMLALIFVSLLTAFGILAIGAESQSSLMKLFRGLNELMLKVTNWVMWFAPIGVFGLVAKTVSTTGGGIFLVLAKYFAVVLCALLFHLFVVLPLVLKFLGRVSPRRHFYAMRNALLTALSTSSSSATLPVTMRAVQENAGVSKRVASFTLPLGATVNMDGTALYECIAVIFVAQVLGWDLSIAQQFMVVTLALLTSIGVAGVPSASFVAIVIIVNNVGIPNADAVIGLLLAVDRPLDMVRTAVNIFSDSCGAVVIAKSEGEEVLTGETRIPIDVAPGPQGDGDVA